MKHEGPGGVTRFIITNNIFNTPYDPVEKFDLKVLGGRRRRRGKEREGKGEEKRRKGKGEEEGEVGKGEAGRGREVEWEMERGERGRGM
jgi:hypothetical protein